jgi:ribosomal protein L32E
MTHFSPAKYTQQYGMGVKDIKVYNVGKHTQVDQAKEIKRINTNMSQKKNINAVK